MTFAYSVEELEHSEGRNLFVVKRVVGAPTEEDDEVLEIEALDAFMTLRASDVEAFEWIVSGIEALLERGAPMDAAQA